MPIVPDDNLPSSTPYGLAIPPWKVDGRPRDLDPYSIDDEELRFRVLWEVGLRHGVAWRSMHVERYVDPNAQDGDWPAFAFFPHVPVLVAPVDVGQEGETGEWIVPMYLSLSDALLAERGRRRERRLVSDFEERQEAWQAYLTEVLGRSIEVLQRVKRERGDGGG